MDFPSANVIWQSCAANLRTFLIIGAGVIAARKGVLHSEARKNVSAFIVNVCMPCFLIYELGEAFTASKLKKWWILPLIAIMNVLISLVIALIAKWIVRPSKRFERPFVCLLVVGNFAFLPLVITEAICEEATLYEGETHDGLCDDGVAFISFILIVYNFVIWSFGVNYIQGGEKYIPDSILEEREKQMKEIGKYGSENSINSEDSLEIEVHGSSDLESKPVNNNSNGKDNNQPEKETEVTVETSSVLSTDDKDKNDKNNNNSNDKQPENSTDDEPEVLSWKEKTIITIKKIFTKPTLGITIGILVALYPPIKDLFFGEDPPLKFMSKAVEIIGAPCVAGMTMLLGANLSQGTSLKGLDVRKRDIFAVWLVRLVILPIIGCITTELIDNYTSAFDGDRMMKFVMLMETCVTPAMAMAILAQIADRCKKEVSATLFYVYALSLPPLIIFISIFLQLSELI